MEQFSNVLIALLPDSDIWKMVGLLFVGFVVLVRGGQFKLEWIGSWWKRYVIAPYRRRFFCSRGVCVYDIVNQTGRPNPPQTSHAWNWVCVFCQKSYPYKTGHKKGSTFRFQRPESDISGEKGGEGTET